jgi:hypothetical protein
MYLAHEKRRVDQLKDPQTFLKHLFLHELRHALNSDATEQECDEWAFGRILEEPG